MTLWEVSPWNSPSGAATSCGALRKTSGVDIAKGFLGPLAMTKNDNWWKKATANVRLWTALLFKGCQRIVSTPLAGAVLLQRGPTGRAATRPLAVPRASGSSVSSGSFEAVVTWAYINHKFINHHESWTPLVSCTSYDGLHRDPFPPIFRW